MGTWPGMLEGWALNRPLNGMLDIERDVEQNARRWTGD